MRNLFRARGSALRSRRLLPALLIAVGMVAVPATGNATPLASTHALPAGNENSYLTFAQPSSWGLTWSYNEFSPTFFGYLPNYTLLPLAFVEPPSGQSFIPQLATSWQTTGSSVTIHIRPQAKWQNGKPVSANDVLTTMILQGVNGSNMWTNIASTQLPSDHTLVIHLKPGASSTLLLDTLLNLIPVNASEYHRFLAPNLEKDLIQYYASPPTASSKALGNTISTLDKSLTKFSPSTLLGDGPFKLVKITSAEAIMSKWPGFWDAKDIHVPGMRFDSFSGNGPVYGLLLGNKIVDIAQALPTGPILKGLLKTPQLGFLSHPSYAEDALYFNSKKYPLQMLNVRRALSYLIDRRQAVFFENGDYSAETWVKHPDGLFSSSASAVLSRKQIGSLNTYPYNPKRATKLLEKSGFHKRNGQWIMPNGKPFVLQGGAPQGWQQTVTEMQHIGQVFTNFGIKTTTSAIEQPGYWTQAQDGNFDIEWNWSVDNGQLNALAQFESALVSYDFVGPSEPGMGFGPKVTVPGLGKVNIQTTLTNEVNTVTPGTPKYKQLVFDWARLVNKDLPYLSLGDKNQAEEYSTKRFTDWPKPNSKYWILYGYNFNTGIVAMLENGYVKPNGA